MYRILTARNGYYYVQKNGPYGYKKVGGFFPSRTGAREFVTYDRNGGWCMPNNRVVEYL